MTEEIILLDKEEVPEYEENFVIINKMEIKDNDNLLIGITFHGGCKEHLFRLFGYFENDSHLILSLEHNANDDQCKRIVQMELLFNLTSIKNKFNIKNKDNLNNNSLILYLKNLETRYQISD